MAGLASSRNAVSVRSLTGLRVALAQGGKALQKCDLCGGEPACVSVCYPRALQFVEVTDEAILADLGHKMDKLERIRSNLHE